MNCKFFKFFVAAALLLNFNNSFAQDTTDSQPDTAYADAAYEAGTSEEIAGDTAVTKTIFYTGVDSFNEWKNSHDFNYMKYLDSLLRKETGFRTDTVSIDKTTGNKRRVVASSTENSGTILNSLPLKIFFWAAAAFFIGFIVYKLFFSEGFFAKRNIQLTAETSDEPPVGLNDYSKYNELIDQAERKSDYTLSTRYLYLQTLKNLSDSDLILYSPEKTNYSYVRELSGKTYRHDFASLTLSYEYVWYGKFIIDPLQYRELKEQFISFNKKV